MMSLNPTEDSVSTRGLGGEDGHDLTQRAIVPLIACERCGVGHLSYRHTP
jgi:hypothetical protein